MFCPECGKEIQDSSAFCKYCGNKIAVKNNTQEPKVSDLQNGGNGTVYVPKYAGANAFNESFEKKEKKRGNTGLIIVIIILSLLLCAAVTAIILMKPWEYSPDGNETSGYEDEFENDGEESKPTGVSVELNTNTENSESSDDYKENGITDSGVDTAPENNTKTEEIIEHEENEPVSDRDESEQKYTPENTEENTEADVHLSTLHPTGMFPEEEPEPVPGEGNGKADEYLARCENIDSLAEQLGETAYTQYEINAASAQIYEEWDNLLNEVYIYLKNTLPTDEFEALKADELEWIKEKENAVEAEGKRWEGGSGAPMAMNGVATSYTKERCYYLISLIK